MNPAALLLYIMFDRMDVDVLINILSAVSDVRSCRLVNVRICNIIGSYLPDMDFWTRFEPTCENICAYGLPKMFELIERKSTLAYCVGTTGRMDYLMKMINRGIEFNITHMFEWAIQGNHMQMVKYMISRKINCEDAILLAGYNGYTDIVTCLVKAGYPCNMQLVRKLKRAGHDALAQRMQSLMIKREIINKHKPISKRKRY
jgi:hypothetical protein